MIFIINCALIIAGALSQAKAEQFGIKFRWHDVLGFSIIGVGAVFLPAFAMNLLYGMDIQVGLGYLVLGSALSTLLFTWVAVIKKEWARE